MRLTRTYFTCCCGLGGCVADAALGLEGGRSTRLRKLAALAGVDRAFAPAAALLQVFLGVVLDPETVRRDTHAAAPAAARFQMSEAAAAPFAAAPGHVELAIDAGKVNTRERGWRDFKLLCFGKRPRGPAAAPEDWLTRVLPERTAAFLHGRVASIDEYAPAWRGIAQRLGVASGPDLDVQGDGAEWIWNAVAAELPGADQNLDAFHASEYLAATTRALHGEGAAFAARHAAAQTLLLNDGWNGVCRWVGEEWTALHAGPAAAVAAGEALLQRTVRYFLTHHRRLNYRQRLANGQALGSGAVEGAVKTMALRLKARGARWRTDRVDGMLALLAVRHGMSWRQHWSLAA